MKTQTLKSAAGRTIRAVVVYHRPIHATASTACGSTFEAMRRQEFPIHQTSASADCSDVNCAGCKAVRS